jgi:hypothetical protein
MPPTGRQCHLPAQGPPPTASATVKSHARLRALPRSGLRPGIHAGFGEGNNPSPHCSAPFSSARFTGLLRPAAREPRQRG